VKTADNTQENICLVCAAGPYSPECGGEELVFGDGYGNDNIIGCDAFEAAGGVPDGGWAGEVE
jgi:hypothetical protein